jgi:hypothetical protein
VNAVMNLEIPLNVGNLLVRRATISFSTRTLLYAVIYLVLQSVHFCI